MYSQIKIDLVVSCPPHFTDTNSTQRRQDSMSQGSCSAKAEAAAAIFGGKHGWESIRGMESIYVPNGHFFLFFFLEWWHH